MGSNELRRPCAHCPFRSDQEPYLEYMRAVEIVGNLHLGNIFPCHETTTHDDEGEYVPSGKERMCAGAGITMLKYDGPNNYMRILGRIYPGYLEGLEEEMEVAPLYEDLEEWIAAHDPQSKEQYAWRWKRAKQDRAEEGEEEGSRAGSRP